MRILLTLVFIFFFFSSFLGAEVIRGAKAEEFSYSELQVKAAYILKIRGFVEWPKGETPPVVCVVGDDLLGSSLAYIQHNSNGMNGLKIEKLFISSDFEKCQVLFLGQESFEGVQKVINKLRGKPILTISDIKDFSVHGGMIEFYLEGQRVKMKVNNRIAKESGLFISSKLLQVAKVVE